VYDKNQVHKAGGRSCSQIAASAAQARSWKKEQQSATKMNQEAWVLDGCWFILEPQVFFITVACIRRDHPGQTQGTAMLALSIVEACARSGVGRTTIYEMIKTGRLSARKCGRRTLILTDDLQRCLEELPPVKTAERKKISATQERAS
jgi:excisionase family DNA binding protein